MKKYIIILLTIFLIPIFVNAETLTYEVCESGCEYTSLKNLQRAINSIPDFSNIDIIININSNFSGYISSIGSNDNIANSITINGNNFDFGEEQIFLYAKDIKLYNILNSQNIFIYNSNNIYLENVKNINGINASNFGKIVIEKSRTYHLSLFTITENEEYVNNNEKINLQDVLEIDTPSYDNIKEIALAGNLIVKNMDFSNKNLLVSAGNVDIFGSKINKIISLPFTYNTITNVYNCTLASTKYKNVNSQEDTAWNEINQYIISSTSDPSVLSYDIYDIDLTNMDGQYKSTTTIYFDKEAKLKPGDKLNLAEYLDYYTEDKEIEYTIEDESIAKIENKELMGLKEGSTKVTVTTDEGHVIYRINLVVEKETIPEKIDKMTIKVPITGSKVKAWVLIVGGILLVIVGICTSMLIKRKK